MDALGAAEIEAEIGLTVSIGLAPSKFLAKIASDLDKPKGFAVIGAAEAKDFLSSRPVAILPGVGPAMDAGLAKAGYRTVGDLAAAEAKTLVQRFGDYGLRLHRLSHAQDARAVDPDQERKSVSAETTFNTDLSAHEALEDELWPLCERVARKMRKEGIAGGVATLKLKTADFRTLTRRRTVSPAIQTAKALFAVTRDLLAAETGGVRYRLIGAGLSALVEADDAPSDLFGEADGKALKSEKAMDALRDRFGAGVIVSGRALKGKPTP
jgi:DNA polymerase-4